MICGAPHSPQSANPQLAFQVATTPTSVDLQLPHTFNPQLAPQEATMPMSVDMMQPYSRARPMFASAKNPVSSSLAPTTTRFSPGIMQSSMSPTVGTASFFDVASFGPSGASSRAASTPALSRANSPPAMRRTSGAATFDMASPGTSGYSSRATTTPALSRASSPPAVPRTSGVAAWARSRSCPAADSDFPGIHTRIQQFDMSTPRPIAHEQMFDMATPRVPAQTFSMATPRFPAQTFSMATPRVPRENHLSH